MQALNAQLTVYFFLDRLTTFTQKWHAGNVVLRYLEAYRIALGFLAFSFERDYG